MTKHREKSQEKAARRRVNLLNAGPEGHIPYADQINRIGPFLWTQALRNPDDDILTGAVRVLHAVWLMLLSCDERAYKVMARMEELCIEYERERRLEKLFAVKNPRDWAEYHHTCKQESWGPGELHPRAGLDRNEAMRKLLLLTEWLRKALTAGKWKGLLPDDSLRRGKEPGPILKAAEWFACLAPMFHPAIGQTDSSNRMDRAAGIADRWRNRWKNADPETPPSPSRLLVDGLVALGMVREDVEDWIKPIRSKSMDARLESLRSMAKELSKRSKVKAPSDSRTQGKQGKVGHDTD
jgi:hypothetical protein